MIRLPSSRVHWLQILTVIAIVVPMFAGIVFVRAKHQNLENHVADLEPKYARLLGMSESKSQFDAVSLQANEQLKKLAYPSTQDVTQSGNDAQQRIRTLFSDSKLDIISVQVLPVKSEGGFDRIPIELRVEGDLTGIQNALTLLSSQSPLVVPEEVTLQAIGAVRPASVQRLSGQFLFSVFRMHP